MEQRKKIELYLKQIHSIHEKNPSLKELMKTNPTQYETYMAEQLPRFKEKYKTLYKLSIMEFDQPSFQQKLNHFLQISESILKGKKTLEEGTKQIAQEQYDEYVAPLVKKIDENKK